jgi:hypothetical protein
MDLIHEVILQRGQSGPFTRTAYVVDAPQVDATRQKFLSIGRRRFLSLRSLRGLLPLAQFLTTIR